MRSFFRLFFYIALIIGLVGTATGLGIGVYVYFRITRDLPQIESLNDYRPKAISSIYSADGTLIAEAYEEHRYPAKFDEIPLLLRHAFLAAEDASFYTHPGIDFISILRAMWVNLRKSSAKQGASTITQQVVKSLLLSREKTMERKAKEAILSYRLEKALTKDEIFSIYLNEIYLGNNSYGVKAATRAYFRKEMNDLTVGESAFLAGLPQKPSELAKVEHRDMAIQRQHYVLVQMRAKGMITEEQYQEARNNPPTIYVQEEQTIYKAPYFAGYVLKQLEDIFPTIDPYLSVRNPGGYSIYTTVDLKATDIAERSVKKALREVDKRQGWRGPIEKIAPDKVQSYVSKQAALLKDGLVPNQIYHALITRMSAEGIAQVQIGETVGKVNLKEAGWAKRFVNGEAVSTVEPAKMVRVGDIIEVSLAEEKAEDEQKKKDPKNVARGTAKAKEDLQTFVLDQSPILEAAFLVSNTQTGAITAMIGGYDYQRSPFNRVTQALRQPGSSFKPFIYLAALESLNFTPSTIVPDSPISMIAGNGKLWTPGNFDGKYLGPITLRTALQRSRNVVSVFLTQKLGLDRVIKSARRFGLTTPIPPNMSISLGSAEVRMIEMVRGYGAFATGGYLADELTITSIKDRDGREIYQRSPKQKKIIDENDAFIMAHLMEGVVQRGTATVLKQLGRPVAGKTGTTNDQMDAWFIGYTPEWVGGVWVGYNTKRSIGKMETGGKVAAPIFLYFMQEFLADVPAIPFEIPDGVVPVPVDLESGHILPAGTPNSFIEYFKSGTEPKEGDELDQQVPQDYLSSDEF